MRGKAHKFNDYISNTTNNVICCTESHFNENTITEQFTAGTNFIAVRKDRRTHGGGVVIFHDQALNFEELSIPEMDSLEAVALINKSHVISTVYWPPHVTTSTCDDLGTLTEKLHQFVNTHQIGDFNLPGVTWSYNAEESPYLVPNVITARTIEREAINIIHQSDLFQINNHPNRRGKFLDLVFTNKPDDSEVSVDPDSHGIIAGTVHHVAYEIKCGNALIVPGNKYRVITKYDQTILTEALNRIDTSFIPSRSTVIKQLDKIREAFNAAKKAIKIKVRSYEVTHPWLIGDRDYRILRAQVQNIQRSSSKNGLKEARINLRKRYEVLKSKYCKERLNGNNSPLELYNFVKFTKNKKELPQKMTMNGVPVNDIAKSMYKHLESAFAEIEEPLYDPDTTFLTKLKEIWEQNYTLNEEYIHIGNFTEEEILGCINEINTRKDPGISQLNPTEFRKHAERLATILTPVYNTCILIQWTPPDLLKTLLLPIPNPGLSTEITNYRGNAISNVICKIFDKMITRKLLMNTDANISNTQYGFRPSRSTTGCLLDCVQYISEQVKWTRRVDTAFLDMSKAFDRLSHSAIAKALSSIGMPYMQLVFLMQFITARQYYIRINGKVYSEPIIPDGGVGQGSPIGPTLFVLVANQITSRIHPTTMLYQYADDIALIQPVTCGADKDALQCSIDGVNSWCADSGLKINKKKSIIVKFYRGQKDELTDYYCDGTKLPEQNEVKYLGVILDNKLTFNKHAAILNERATRLTYAAWRLARYIRNPQMTLKLYHVYIEPILLYGSAIWAFRTKKQMQLIETSHRIATRAALKTPPYPVMPNYLAYVDRCARLHELTSTQRMTQIVIINLRRLSDGLTFSQNGRKIENSIDEPQPNRRTQPPLANPACKKQYTNTPIGNMLTVLTTVNIDYGEWIQPINMLKRKLLNNVLLYI